MRMNTQRCGDAEAGVHDPRCTGMVVRVSDTSFCDVCQPERYAKVSGPTICRYDAHDPFGTLLHAPLPGFSQQGWSQFQRGWSQFAPTALFGWAYIDMWVSRIVLDFHTKLTVIHVPATPRAGLAVGEGFLECPCGASELADEELIVACFVLRDSDGNILWDLR